MTDELDFLSPRLFWFGWTRKHIQILSQNSQVIYTSKGPIEYAIRGNGPMVMGLHGGAGGFDQGLLFFNDLFKSGEFSLLVPSRPGYLRTPISVGRSFEEQADAMAILLDSLKIDKVAIIGCAAGGSAALQFALRHPGRLWGLILISPVSQRYTPEQPNISTERIFFSDFGVWLMSLIAYCFPKKMVTEVVSNVGSYTHEQRKEVIAKIHRDPQKMAIICKLISTLAPFGVRKEGLYNDLYNLAMIHNWPLEMIQTPTLVIHGVRDGDVDIMHGEHCAQTIPDAEFLRLNDACHLIDLADEAQLVSQHKISFLRRCLKSFVNSNQKKAIS